MKISIEFDTKNKAELEEIGNLIGNLLSVMPVERTETPQKSTKKVKVTPEPIPSEEKASTVTLEDLQKQTRKALEKLEREDVKKIITKYANKLTEVLESDYEKLFEDLKAVS